MKNKKFDCVKMMRDIRNEVTEDLKKLSPQELIDYLNKKYPDFRKKQTQVKGRI